MSSFDRTFEKALERAAEAEGARRKHFGQPSVTEAPREELSDTRLSESTREELKKIVASFALNHTDEELYFLACAFDTAAHRKRKER